MNIQSSSWQWNQFRDLYLFYFGVIGIPLFSISAYCALFIGHAELAPIPEGYEPREEEYERSPITR
jgi:NADH dehydrogenase (ubiquinone) 1 beta subcomplex subunit 5